MGADKGFLMPRVALVSTTLPNPLTAHVAGMSVYNIATAGSAPNNVVPGIYYNDGNKWQQVVSGTNGGFLMLADSTVRYITPAQMAAALKQKLDIADTAALLAGFINAAYNGLHKNGRSVGLGGMLTEPTAINTSTTNTLSIQGLPLGATTDSVVVSENGTGILKKIPAGSLSNTAKAVYSAASGQNTFIVLQPITDINKISLFRNGVRLEIEQAGINTVRLEPGVNCDANDEIRIIQLY